MKNQPELYKGQWWLACDQCKTLTVVSDPEVLKIICSRCVYINCYNILPDEEKQKLEGSIKPESKKPPGWHFRKVFVDENGNVFHKGKEQPELKGTLEPTKVKKSVKEKTNKKKKLKSIDNMSEKEINKLAKKYKKDRKK